MFIFEICQYCPQNCRWKYVDMVGTFLIFENCGMNLFFFGEFLVILVKYLILLKMTLDTLQQNCLVASSVLSYNYYTVPYELCHVLTENWQTWHRQFLWWRRPNVSLKGVRFSQQFFLGKELHFYYFFMELAISIFKRVLS